MMLYLEQLSYDSLSLSLYSNSYNISDEGLMSVVPISTDGGTWADCFNHWNTTCWRHTIISYITVIVGSEPQQALKCSSEVGVWISDGSDTQNTRWRRRFYPGSGLWALAHQCSILCVRNVQSGCLTKWSKKKDWQRIRWCYPRVLRFSFYLELMDLLIIRSLLQPLFIYREGPRLQNEWVLTKSFSAWCLRFLRLGAARYSFDM